MQKRILLTIFFIFLAISIVSAKTPYNPNINIQAEANQNLVIRLKDVNTSNVFTSLLVTTSQKGTGSTEFETERDKVEITVIYIQDKDKFLQSDNIIKEQEIGIFSTHNTITLDLQQNIFNTIEAPKTETTQESNNTAINEVNQTNLSSQNSETEGNKTNTSSQTSEFAQEQEKTSEEEGKSTITGHAIKDIFTLTNILYIAGALILIAGILFFFVFRKSHTYRPEEDKEIRIIKLSHRLSGEGKFKDAEKRLLDAEKDLRQAQSELNEIKNRKSRIEEAKKDFEEARLKLERLKREEERD